MAFRVVRIMLRLVTLVLTISAVVFILVGGFWYMWRNAQERAPKVRLNITADKIESTALGLYLRYRNDEVIRPADAASDREVTFVVEPGESVTGVAYNLQAQGLVTDPELFRRLVQYHHADGDIQVGVYDLRPNMTMEEIMGELRHGRLPTVAVTIPEGWRLEQVGERLEQEGVVAASEFAAAAQSLRTDYPFLRDRPANAPATLEGFLFPDTYQLPKNTTADKVVAIMLSTFDQRVPEELRAKAADHSLSFYELIVLASIVEREAVVPAEQPLIAGVFHNRLKQGMYIQADPTVIYAKGYSAETGKWWNPMIQEEAITVQSPYNTFLNPGLPPGPICSPGLGAIKATLEPEETQYLFFRAKGDGSHVFAVTYEEHLVNQELYGEK